MVPRAPRRHGAVRREPAEEVPGHLSLRLRDRRRGKSLWEELKSVFEFWVEQGVTIFRVDNPHTKAFAFWEWCLARAEAGAPGAHLPLRGLHAPAHHAQAGEDRLHAVVHLLHLAQYEAGIDRVLHRAHAASVARVLPAQRLAQHARHPARDAADGRPRRRSSCASCSPRPRRRTTASTARPTSSSSTSRASRAARNTSNSEKYEIRRWDLERADSLRELIARLNRIRHENPALQRDWSLRFHPIDNPQLLVYSKREGSERHPHRVEPRFPASAVGLRRARPARAQYRPARDLRGARPPLRRSLHLERRAQLCRAQSRSSCPRTCSRWCGDDLAERGGDFSARPGGALVQGRRPLPGARQGVLRFEQRRHGRLQGPHLEARLHPGPRRLRAVAAAVLSVAAQGRRLRRLRLPQRASAVRRGGGLQAVRARGAAPRPQGDHGARGQPHLRPAPLVPGGAARAGGLAEARLLRLERHRPEVQGHAHHLHRHRDLELGVGPGGEAVLLAPLLQPPAGSQLRQPARAEGRVPHHALLARHGRGRVPARCDSVSHRARGHLERERARDACGAEGDPQAHRPELSQQGAARRSEHVAGGRAAVLRRRRRMPHGVPLPADAAHVHGHRAGRPPPAGRDHGPDPRDPGHLASGRSSCATTTSSRSRW